MSTRTPSGLPDDADEFDYNDERAVCRFLREVFGPPPKPRKRSVRSAKSVQSVSPVFGRAKKQGLTPGPEHPGNGALPDREWTFSCHEPRFKSVAVITVTAPTQREAFAQAYLAADALAESLRNFLKK